MEFGDVIRVVELHRLGFSGFFLTFLGAAFLRELYRATLADPSGVGIVAEHHGIICGFVSGTFQPVDFYSRLLRKRWWRFAIAALFPFIKKPSIIFRLLRAFSKPGEAMNKLGCGTLMSLAVMPDAKGQGLGEALVCAFLKESSLRGLKCVDLTTDRDNNEQVNIFYQKMGFVRNRTYTTPEGRVMNEYVYSLNEMHRSDSA
jgi:ribosomal protein S18 acetylase RimI-like enzyme